MKKRFVFDLTDCCVRRFTVSIDAFEKISNVYFTGGCPGFIRSFGAELEGCALDEAIQSCDSVICGGESHKSCSDTLCSAVKQKLVWLKENLN